MKRVIIGSNTCLPRSNYFYLWCEGNISDKIPNFAQIMSQDETMNTTKPKSIYRYGAEYGLYMGLFLTVISLQQNHAELQVTILTRLLLSTYAKSTMYLSVKELQRKSKLKSAQQ